MLELIDHTTKSVPSIYRCDRCNVIMEKDNRKGIYVTNNKGVPNKKWDLCPRCFKALEKGIAKGVKNE